MGAELRMSGMEVRISSRNEGDRSSEREEKQLKRGFLLVQIWPLLRFL
jgi:hypothetical protein